MYKLVFASEGLLLSAADTEVTGWRVSDGKMCCKCPGAWIGVSQDGALLLTLSEDGSVLAWNTATGAPVGMKTLNPVQFADYQRLFVTADRPQFRLIVKDAFGQLPPKTVQYASSGNDAASLDGWALAPDAKSLLVAFWGDEGGHDWAMGICYDCVSGRPRYQFEVNRFTNPGFRFSATGGWFMMAGQVEINVYHVTSGREVTSIWLTHNCGGSAALHPRNQEIMAVAAQIVEGESSRRGQPHKPPTYRHEVHLLNLRTNDPQALAKQTATVIQRFEATGIVTDIAFSPSGQLLACFSKAGHIDIWQLPAGTLRHRLMASG